MQCESASGNSETAAGTAPLPQGPTSSARSSTEVGAQESDASGIKGKAGSAPGHGRAKAGKTSQGDQPAGRLVPGANKGQHQVLSSHTS